MSCARCESWEPCAPLLLPSAIISTRCNQASAKNESLIRTLVDQGGFIPSESNWVRIGADMANSMNMADYNNIMYAVRRARTQNCRNIGHAATVSCDVFQCALVLGMGAGWGRRVAGF